MLEGAQDVGVADQPAEARVLQRSGERRSSVRLIPRNGTRGSDALVRTSDGSRERREANGGRALSHDRRAWCAFRVRASSTFARFLDVYMRPM